MLIDLTSAKELTRYAALTRYPHSAAMSEAQVDQAIQIAEAVVSWSIPLVPLPSGPP